MSEPLRDYEQAAEWLGVPRRWLENQVRIGKAPHAKLGRYVRFTQEHLDFIVRSNEPMRATPVLEPTPATAGPRPSGRRKRKP